MSWRTVRLVCMALIGAEIWAQMAGERQLVNLFAILALGVLAIGWVLSSGEDGDER